MDHHSQNHSSAPESNLKIAFWLNAGFAVVEITGGLLTNSMAILSGAFHDLGDSVALGLAWYFQRISLKRPDENFTYGYQRFSVVGATISALILMVGSGIIITQAIPRLLHPKPVHVSGMLWLAVVGIIVNGIAMLRLRAGKSQNEKIISIHLLEDVLSWLAVLLIALVMMFRNIPELDPALSLLITAFILNRAVGNFRQTFRIFLQATPSTKQTERLKTKLETIEGIHNVHDLHYWTMDGSYHIASLHACVDPEATFAETERIKQTIRDALSAEGYRHATIEIEPAGKLCDLRNC